MHVTDDASTSAVGQDTAAWLANVCCRQLQTVWRMLAPKKVARRKDDTPAVQDIRVLEAARTSNWLLLSCLCCLHSLQDLVKGLHT